jgi:hypothetical protein
MLVQRFFFLILETLFKTSDIIETEHLPNVKCRKAESYFYFVKYLNVNLFKELSIIKCFFSSDKITA